MKCTPLGCTVFGIFGQVISNLLSFLYFSAGIYWITNGYMANMERTYIHLGLCIAALVITTYSFLMSCHICYVIHHDFDNIKAYFWTRIHLFILVLTFFVLSLIELSMYLEISNTHLKQIFNEVVANSSVKVKVNSASALQFPNWMEQWQTKHACCGIVSYKDYAEYGDKKSVSSNCCRYNKDFVNAVGRKCGDGVLRMSYSTMKKKIYTKGCGEEIKESFKMISLYGCILASISTVFVVTSALSYLTFLQQYSQQQHTNRMKRYDVEEREQLKSMSKKRQQQQLSRNSSSKGPAKAHGTKIMPSTSHSQQSRSRSRSSSRSHKKCHILSAEMDNADNAEYQCEEKSYFRNIDKKSVHRGGSLKSRSCPPDIAKQGSCQNSNPKIDRHEKLYSSRSLPKHRRSKSRPSSSHSRSNKEEAEDFEMNNRNYRDTHQDFPSFKSNENLFLNLIDAASSRRMSRNISNCSSMDFQEDVLVPRVLTKKSKQVLFDQNSNVYYDGENDASADFEEEQQNSNSSENTTLDIKFTEEDDDDDDCDPGDIIVRQL